MVQGEQVRDRTDGQDIGIEVDDLGELGEPEGVKLGEGGGEIRPSCKRGSESSLRGRFDINPVGLEGRSPIGPLVLEPSDGCRNARGDVVLNGGIAQMGPSRSTP